MTRLRIIKSEGETATVYAVDDTSWPEDTVTWATAPAHNPAALVSWTTGNPTAPGTLAEFDVANYLMQNPNKNSL